MNRKHKHKQNKQTNPVPPQKPQEKEDQESKLKIEERVPEIVSEVIPEPCIEIKNEPEVETPNKPKRNRRKKKTEDPELEEKCNEDVIQNTLEEENASKTGEESYIKVTTEIKADDTEQLIPTSRKKKNKNKNKNVEKGESKTSEVEEIKSEVIEISDILNLSKEEQDVKNETDDILKVHTCDKVDTEETTLQSKKKNKNKKNKKSKVDFEKECEVIDEISFDKTQSKSNTDSDTNKTSTEAEVKGLNELSVQLEKSNSDMIKEKLVTEITEKNKEDVSKSKKKNKKKRNESETSTEMKVDEGILLEDTKTSDISSKSDKPCENVNLSTTVKEENLLEKDIAKQDEILKIDPEIKTCDIKTVDVINVECKEISQKSKKKNKKKLIESTATENEGQKEETLIISPVLLEDEKHTTDRDLSSDTNTEIKCEEKEKDESVKSNEAEQYESKTNILIEEFKPILQSHVEKTAPQITCEEKNKIPIIEPKSDKTEQPKVDSFKDLKSEILEKTDIDKVAIKIKGEHKGKKNKSIVPKTEKIEEQKLDKPEDLLSLQSEQITLIHHETVGTEHEREQEMKNIVLLKSCNKEEKDEDISNTQSKEPAKLQIEMAASDIMGDLKTVIPLPQKIDITVIKKEDEPKEHSSLLPKQTIPLNVEKESAELKCEAKNKKPLLSMELKAGKREKQEVKKPEETKSEVIVQQDIENTVIKDHKESFKDNTQKSKKKNKKEKHPVESLQLHGDLFDIPMSSTQNVPISDDTLESKQNIKKTDPVATNTELSSLTSQDYIVEHSNSGNISPDSIEFQRSENECNLFMDPNNNNMLIEEIITPDIPVQNLNVPVELPDTPFIKELEDLPSPINITSRAIPLPYIKKSEPIDVTEKTDLKSKVLEVNQDMEELRLSIEKSLAELTCMETSEEIPKLIYLQSAIDQNVSIPSSAVDEKGKILHQSQPEPKKVTSPFSNTFDMFPKFKSFEEPKKDEQPTAVPSVAAEPKKEDTVSLANILGSRPIPQVTSVDVPLPITVSDVPNCPARKDKGKGKSNKKSKSEVQSNLSTVTTTSAQSSSSTENKSETGKSEQKEPQKESQQTKNKEHSGNDKKQADNDGNNDIKKDEKYDITTLHQENTQNFEPIDKFEDAMTSSSDDVNKSFELIADEASFDISKHTKSSSEASEYSKDEEKKLDEKQKKENPLVSHPKNLLGHPDIPVQSNRMDYKKEKSKPPNSRQARVRIKDAISPEKASKLSKESQTENQPRIVITKPFKNYDPYMNDDYVYKYSFRNVFLPHVCHVCKKNLNDVRVSCNLCNLFFYCSNKHREDDRPQHQALCLAISTIVHLKGEKYIYGDAKDVTGMNYRLLRMQMIVSCEKIVKRRLVPWEQEALLYPRMCADTTCREWRDKCLKDCETCGQISYCKDFPEHFPKNHLRWCKSYTLYQKLVIYQQTKGRLEPRLPTKVITATDFEVPDKINELLATMYEEKIDMDDLQYAALTQLATAPLTAAYSHQVYTNVINSNYANGVHKKSSFTLHVVGAELQFEADALNKWEIFFLHIRPAVKELNVVLIGPELNPSNLPLELLAKIKLCENCHQNNRKVVFSFYDKKLYHEFVNSEEFTFPDIVCAFNPSLNRSLGINGKDTWSATINSILKLRTPFCVTSYTPEELPKDLARIKEYAVMNYKTITEPSHNPYASIRPDRNFISDDEMPLLFKNYSYAIVCGQY